MVDYPYLIYSSLAVKICGWTICGYKKWPQKPKKCWPTKIPWYMVYISISNVKKQQKLISLYMCAMFSVYRFIKGVY